MPEPIRWHRRGAWAGIVAEGRHGRRGGEPGVRAALREGLALATIIGREDRAAELDGLLSAIVGIAPPKAPKTASGLDSALVWAGPYQWLCVSNRPELVPRLAAGLAGLAAVSDQSDARAILRVSGPRIREVLAKGCPIDLHPRAFAPGDAALTAIAHIGVHIWQIDAAPTYDVTVSRSMAASFWSWFAAAAAEFGYDVTAPEKWG